MGSPKKTKSLKEPSEKTLSTNLKARLKMVKQAKKKREDNYVKCKICHKTYTDSYCLQSHMKLHTSELLFECDQCDYRGKTQKYLSRHIFRSHNAPRHKCDICGKMFHFLTRLTEHKMVHTGEKPHKCDVCDKAFRAKYTLDTHKLIHTNKKPYKCKYCDYACRDSSTLRKHHARHTGNLKTFKCTYCTKQYDTKAYLKEHVAEKHFRVDLKVLACDQCDKKFKNKNTLKNHVQAVHEKSTRVTCEVCGHELTNWHNLASHLRIHINVRPYRCSYKKCRKRFKDKHSLKRHEIIHWPGMQLSCDICERRFARRCRLTTHLRRIHGIVDGEIEYFVCDFCGMRYDNKSRLIRHIQKHTSHRKTYICDICKLVTHKKRNILMHIKYGHGGENDRTCKICHKDYKLHAYLIIHYINMHGIRYKTIKEIKEDPVCVKEEPIEPTPEEELVEIKEEPVDDLNEDQESIETIHYSNAVLSEDISRSMTQVQQLGHPESVIDELFRRNVEEWTDVRQETGKIIMDQEKENYVRKRIKKLMIRARHSEYLKCMEGMRRQYNERIRAMTRCSIDKGNLKIKFLNIKKNSKNNSEKDNNNIDNEVERDEDISGSDITNKCDRDSDMIDKDSISYENERHNHKETKVGDIAEEDNDNIDKNSNTNTDGKDDDEERDSDNDYEDDEDETNGIREKRNAKLKINTHQCYICFKLFETKSKLLHHCKIHFDVCNEVMLKKCPLCEFVTKSNITRHLKLIHNINVRLLYGHVHDNTVDSDKSRYSYSLKHKKIKELEVIPSIKNLNKIAYIKIDKRNKQYENKSVAKTKLIKKGNEWIVEKEKIDIKDYILPEFNKRELKMLKGVAFGDSYLDKLKVLSRLAKQNGVNMLYPCDGCEKICRTFSALKLHNRKHEKNPKPFKKKVWKHKLKLLNDKGTKKSKAKPAVSSNRYANPKPIVNKHKCDDKLKEFYETNIKGADIEFWQFLKIYNKMNRENINDFDDLEKRTDFGIHYNEKPVSNDDSKKVDNVKVKSKVRNKFVRKIRISKQEHLKRLEIKERLRKKIAEESRLLEK